MGDSWAADAEGSRPLVCLAALTLSGSKWQEATPEKPRGLTIKANAQTPETTGKQFSFEIQPRPAESEKNGHQDLLSLEL